jgi:hypothetical protein
VGPARAVVAFSLGEQLQQVQDPLLALIGVHVLEHRGGFAVLGDDDRAVPVGCRAMSSAGLRLRAVTGSMSFKVHGTTVVSTVFATWPAPSSVPAGPSSWRSVRHDPVHRARPFTMVVRAGSPHWAATEVASLAGVGSPARRPAGSRGAGSSGAVALRLGPRSQRPLGPAVVGRVAVTPSWGASL